jgi:DNA-binding transcriptional ArsR family regulator
MGITKSEIFTAKQNKLAAILKAMAHPARIAIIQHLVKAEHCICSNFVEELGLAQPTVSQHLKELKSVGIIKGCVEGNSISYCLDASIWLQVRKEFDALFKS